MRHPSAAWSASMGSRPGSKLPSAACQARFHIIPWNLTCHRAPRRLLSVGAYTLTTLLCLTAAERFALSRASPGAAQKLGVAAFPAEAWTVSEAALPPTKAASSDGGDDQDDDLVSDGGDDGDDGGGGGECQQARKRACQNALAHFLSSAFRAECLPNERPDPMQAAAGDDDDAAEFVEERPFEEEAVGEDGVVASRAFCHALDYEAEEAR